MPRIRSVLFDLGDTLMHSQEPWLPVFDRANHALAQVLQKHALPINEDRFPKEFSERLTKYRNVRDESLQETSTTGVLFDLLEEKFPGRANDALVREAMDAMYAITQANWHLEEDALATLAQLQEDQYRVGMISNAGDHRDVIQLVEKFGIGSYFDFILTSAECGLRKPHPLIFELALAHWNIAPDRACMIGDRLDADILGANNAGITSIWITKRIKIPDKLIAEPDAAISSLSQLIPLLKSL
jgi:putative hydrolase of the HAD superfamily